MLDLKMAIPKLLAWTILTQLLWRTQGKSILVIGEDAMIERTHSQFLSALTERGRTVTFKSATAKTIPLTHDGEYLYESIVMLAPQASLETKLPISRLLRFMDSGGNLFTASSTSYSVYTGKVAEAIGIDVDDRVNTMIDFQNSLPAPNNSTSPFIRAGGWVPHVFASSASASSSAASDIAFSGAGATLFRDNELVHALMWGSGSSFGESARGHKAVLTTIPRVVGSGSVLAGAVCTHAGSRATWFGSLEALSNGVFEGMGEAHAGAMKGMLKWAMGDSGVLRVVAVGHGRVADGGARVGDGVPTEYRVKDLIEFAMRVEEWDGAAGDWKGFVADDIQVEFVMMDPWVRARMRMVEGEPGSYKAVIQVPDQIGVYKFKVEYYRPGLSGVKLEKVVAVRPFWHNEYERFIQMASPYYVSAFSMLIGVFLLGVVILFGNDEAVWAEEMSEKLLKSRQGKTD